MTRIGIVLGSTRPGRRGRDVAHWVLQLAGRRDDADFELIDLADYPLPHLDEPIPPSMGRYHDQHTHDRAATIARFDRFIYADVRTNVALSLFADFQNFTDFDPGEHRDRALDTLIDEVLAWSEALAPLRRTANAA